MSSKHQMSRRLIAAARALAGISQEAFATAARLPVETLRVLEGRGSAWLEFERDVEGFCRKAVRSTGPHV